MERTKERKKERKKEGKKQTNKQRYKMIWANFHKGRKLVATTNLRLFMSKFIVKSL